NRRSTVCEVFVIYERRLVSRAVLGELLWTNCPASSSAGAFRCRRRRLLSLRAIRALPGDVGARAQCPAALRSTRVLPAGVSNWRSRRERLAKRKLQFFVSHFPIRSL